MKTILQRIKFPAGARELYDLYIDSRKHTASTGGEAVLGRRVGDGYSAWGGHIKGKNLVLVPGRHIVQTWRTGHFHEPDLDSLLSLTFEDAEDGGLVTMVHACVPDHEEANIKKGWHVHYWRPWKKYLAAR